MSSEGPGAYAGRRSLLLDLIDSLMRICWLVLSMAWSMNIQPAWRQNFPQQPLARAGNMGDQIDCSKLQHWGEIGFKQRTQHLGSN